MRVFIIFCLLLTSSITLFAQNTETDSLKRLLPTLPEGPQRVLVLEGLSFAYLSSFPDTSLIYAQEALSLAQKIKDRVGEAYCTNAMGNVYFEVGDFPMALEMYLKSLKMKEAMKDQEHAIAVTYFNIVNVYVEQEDYEHALFYLAKATTIDKKLKDSSGIMFDLYSLSSIYLRMKLADSAEYYTDESYRLAMKMGDMNMMGAIVNNFATVNMLKKNYPEAARYFHQSNAYCLAVNDNEVLSSNYLGMAKMFDSLRLADSSIYYARKCVLLAQAAPFFKSVLEAGEFLMNKFAEAKRFDSAFHYQSISIAAKDSLYNIEKVKKVQNLKLVEQQREQSIAAEKLQLRNQIRFYSVIAASIAFLVIAFLLWRNNRQRQKDYKLLEEQKAKTEEALTELKSTQAQLVLKEKMASIGELTSGIAHEIKNPLNFINNFSELNRDLMKELQEEIHKSDRDLAAEEEIHNIIDQNLEKIMLHGQRADSIIKNMLEHSNTSRGAREMVDINKLAEERLRIAYHAMQGKLRATEPGRDQPDVQFETNFDASMGRMSIVADDIGRVLLNLYNNALYSVTEKFHKLGTEYTPLVKVTTKRTQNRIQISVWDNGESIAEDIISKIFQPFFTTKPTGKGTGLGLSLSYDIVAKTYGGEIKVNSKAGEYAEFVIEL